MSTTSIANIIVRVKDTNTELTSADDDRILRWINDTVLFLVNEHNFQAWEGLLTAATEPLAADEYAYLLPDDFVRLKSLLRLNDEGKYVTCIPADRSEFRAWDAAANTYAANEFYYCMRGHSIEVRPVPTVDLTAGLKMDYYYIPEDHGGGDSLSGFLERWRELIAARAAQSSGIRFEDDRKELDRRYVELIQQYRRTYGRRTSEPISMRTLRSKVARRSGFGRIS